MEILRNSSEISVNIMKIICQCVCNFYDDYFKITLSPNICVISESISWQCVANLAFLYAFKVGWIVRHQVYDNRNGDKWF